MFKRQVTKDDYKPISTEKKPPPIWQRLTPLAWVGLFAALVLVLGVCALGATLLGQWQATNNPIASVSAGGGNTGSGNPTPVKPLYPWAMHSFTDASGKEKWLPDDERVVEEAKAGYLAMYEWLKDTTFDLDRRLETGSQYLTGEELAAIEYLVELEEESGERTTAEITREPLRVDYFTRDGLTAYLVDKQTGGTVNYHDPATKEVIRTEPRPANIWIVTMQYDQDDRRWKVANVRIVPSAPAPTP